MPYSLYGILLLLAAGQALAGVYEDEVEQCRTEDGYGRQSVVCDPQHLLANKTSAKLAEMLTSMQGIIPCKCPSGCRREDGTDKFIGLLHVTNNNTTPDLNESMKREYDEAHLGNVTCDHGLILVYLKDTQQFATFRGGDSYMLLTDEDMEKLHNFAAKGGESDIQALQYLITNYKDVALNPIQKADSWLPIAGLIAAVVIVLIIVAILLALLFAKCCCCCAKKKKDVYHVNTLPTYKTIEPLYVITPPSQGQARIAGNDAIYSTAYSGSPLPFPPPPGSSVPLTPSSSTYRNNHRVNQETPNTKRRENGLRAETLGRSPRNGNSAASETDFYSFPAGDPIYATNNRELPSVFSSPMPPVEIYGTIPRAKLSSPPLSSPPQSPDELPFLDPRRKQETQTREELIY